MDDLMQAEQNFTSVSHLESAPGLNADLEMAEMEIASGRLADARLRFAKMNSEQRETPRALILRAKASPTEESRRMLASFVKDILARTNDPYTRSQLCEALALCGDRVTATSHLPEEAGLTPLENSARQSALDAMGTVPDLKAPIEQLTLVQLLQRKLIRRTQH